MSHFYLQHGVFAKAFVWIALARDPLGWVLSVYYFIRENATLTPGKMPGLVTLAKKLALEDYLNHSELFGIIQNAQAKYFASYVTTDSAINDEDLYQAPRLVLDLIDIVGTTDKLHDFFFCRCWKMKWEVCSSLIFKSIKSLYSLRK